MASPPRTRFRDPHAMMADIFNSLGRDARSRVLGALEERDREAAEKIKALMFTFDDLVRLDDGAVRALLRRIGKDTLALALKSGAGAVGDRVFRTMSDRAGRMLREDIAAVGPVRRRDVDRAQAAIVALAKEMAAAGEIVIPEGGDADEMVS